jgi:hypothetical protein
VIENMEEKSVAQCDDGKKNGRPLLCNQETIDRLTYSLRLGSPLKYALKYARIAPETYNLYMTLGRAGEEPYLSFLNAVESCEGEFVQKNLDVVNKAASEKQWSAAAWLLERRIPSNFSKNQTRINIEQKKGGDAADQIMDLMNQTIKLVASGELGIEDAKTVASLLETQRRIAETIQIKERVDQIESKIKNAQASIPQAVVIESEDVGGEK